MRILVMYYSLFGSTLKMAKAVAEGAATVPAAEVDLMRVPELLPESAFERNERMAKARLVQKGIPVAKPEYLADYDGIILGSPSRCGSPCSQMRHFLDLAEPLWLSGKLSGKTGAAFACAQPGQGCETTLLSLLITLMQGGMLIAGLPQSALGAGGVPYGASATVNPAEGAALSEDQLAQARLLGQLAARASRPAARSLTA